MSLRSLQKDDTYCIKAYRRSHTSILQLCRKAREAEEDEDSSSSASQIVARKHKVKVAKKKHHLSDAFV